MASARIQFCQCDHTAVEYVVRERAVRGVCGIFQHSKLLAGIGDQRQSK
jgi:hypothetical protein